MCYYLVCPVNPLNINLTIIEQTSSLIPSDTAKTICLVFIRFYITKYIDKNRVGLMTYPNLISTGI